MSPVNQWSFITNHARALLFIASHPDVRLRDLAAAMDVTERTAYGIVTDLAEAGYVIKEREGRRNRYHIQDHLPLRNTIGRERTIGEVLDLLAEREEPSDATATARPAGFVPNPTPSGGPTASTTHSQPDRTST